MSDGIIEQVHGGGLTLEFHHEYPIADLRGADYNPRRLSPESFERLKQSIDRWGIVKPVIVNKGGVLVAGHQRTKSMTALGITHTPAVVLSKKVRLADEVQFNLLHNRVETEASEVYVEPGQIGEWEFITPDRITVAHREAAAFRAAIGQMVTGHGPWGSVVCDDQGRVVLNSEYAVVCADMKMPLLAYTIPSEAAAQLYADLTGEYGVYDWSGIADKVAPVYNQHYAQLHRLTERSAGDVASGREAGQTIFKSTTWEKKVLPWLTEGHRVVDFGAGYGDYAAMLRDKGFQVWDYEPFRCARGSYAIDIKQVVGMIRALHREVAANGLLDVVMLDSVINSITTNEYQEAVATMCNALCRRDGVFITGTRTLISKQKTEQAKRLSTRSGNLSAMPGFLDDDLVEFKFSKGKWGAQRYHTEESLRALLDRYFEDVHITNAKSSQMYAVCHRPRPVPLEQVKRYANMEFNMPYPNDYRHNRQGPMVAELVRRVAERDGTVIPPNLLD